VFGARAGFSFNSTTGALTVNPGYIDTSTIYLATLTGPVNQNVNIFPDGTGNLVISKGPSTGSVQISSISIASATNTYVPTATNDLTTKAYVDQFSTGGLRYFGSFTSNVTQTQSATADTVNLIVLDATIASNGVAYDPLNPSHVIITNAGKYNAQFTLQFRSNATAVNFYAWFRINGVDVQDSNSRWVIDNNKYQIGTVNWMDTFAAGDYIEIVWWADNAGAEVVYIAPQAAVPGVSPALPGVPAAIVTVNPV
jgi:hypothetical protein